MEEAGAAARESALHRSLYSFGVPWPEYNEGITYTDIIRSADEGLRLIDFYSSKYKSSAPLQGWLYRIQNGQIRIDGEVVTDPDRILRADARVVYHRLPWKEPDVPYLIEVLYEDDDIVALNKPSGLQVLPGGLFQQRTVLKQLEWKVWNRTISSDVNSTWEKIPAPVHRLGRGTSGVLLCAKSKLAKTCLADYFANGTAVVGGQVQGNLKIGDSHRISKVYRALVTGILQSDKVVIHQPIGVIRYPGVATGLYIASSSGKPALSKVHVLERKFEENRTLIKVKIHSGRPHQIRIHLAFIGHPLIGDPLYDIGGTPKFMASDYVDETYAKDGKRGTAALLEDLHTAASLRIPISKRFRRLSPPISAAEATAPEVEEPIVKLREIFPDLDSCARDYYKLRR